MSITTEELLSEMWPDNITRHTGTTFTADEYFLFAAASQVWGNENPPYDWQEKICNIFNHFDDIKLAAMEKCSHKNTPFGHCVRVVIMERALLGLKKI